jgi:hypothetical protein
VGPKKLLFTSVSTPASHCRSMGSILGQYMWDVWWTYLQWDKFLLQVLQFSPVNIIPPKLHANTVCPTRYRTRHFFNVMSTAIPGEVWRPTSAEQVLHLDLVEETGNQGDFIGRAHRRSSKNECRVR